MPSLVVQALGSVIIGALLAAGCTSAGSLTRDSGGTRLVFDAPAEAVYTAALEAVAGGEFVVDSQDQARGEIRLQRGMYMHGLFVCYGNVLAIFVTPESETRTRVEVVEGFVSKAQLVGCRSQAPAYIARLTSKVRAADRKPAPADERSGR